MTPRVYLPQARAFALLALPPPKARHLQTVLRLPQGAKAEAFDGAGNAYAATLQYAGKGQAALQLGEALPPKAQDAGARVVAGQFLCAPAKMDWAVEKMTELGCAQICPLVGGRGRPQKASPAALARWRRLAQAAAEQCGRASVPPVEEPLKPAAWLQTLPPAASAPRFALLPQAAAPLASLAAKAAGGQIVIACGNESGFAAQEEDLLLQNGFAPASLGARVLRAETAALAALAIISQL